MNLVTSTFTWLGDKVKATVQNEIDRRLVQSGNEWLRISRSLAPEKTGYLKSQEDFQVANNTLILIMGAPYDIFQEFGTRNIRPHPHVRPALNAIGRIWGRAELDFNRPGGGTWQGIYATGGGFTIPTAIQPRPLHGKQVRHVQQHLVRGAKAHHKGNVARAKMKVRKHQ